jgi:hypothetical protein
MKYTGKQRWHVKTPRTEFRSIEFALGLLGVIPETGLGQDQVTLGFPKRSTTEARHGGVCQSESLIGAATPRCNFRSIKIDLGLRHQLPQITERRGGCCKHRRSVRRVPGGHVGTAETSSCPRRLDQQAGFIKLRQDILECPA